MSALHINIIRHVIHAAHVIRDLELRIQPGEIVCLLGPSGCGKSTTLRLTAGLELLQFGEVSIGERLLTGEGVNIPPEARDIGIVFQHPALFPHLTLAKNVAFGLKTRQGATATAHEWLEKVGLNARADDYPHMLSGGEQQRVALVRALATRPRAMLLDEPFASLDHALRTQIRNEVHTLLKEAGSPTLLVSHDPEDALLMADRIGVMDHGKLVQLGTAEILYDNPATPFVAGLFGELNQWEVPVQGGIVDTPIGSYPAPDVEPGRQCIVALRPEHLQIIRDPQGDVNEAVAMQVIASHAMGQHRRVTVMHEASGAESVVHDPLHMSLTQGETIYLQAQGDKIMLFPQK